MSALSGCVTCGTGRAEAEAEIIAFRRGRLCSEVDVSVLGVLGTGRVCRERDACAARAFRRIERRLSKVSLPWLGLGLGTTLASDNCDEAGVIGILTGDDLLGSVVTLLDDEDCVFGSGSDLDAGVVGMLCILSVHRNLGYV